MKLTEATAPPIRKGARTGQAGLAAPAVWSYVENIALLRAFAYRIVLVFLWLMDNTIMVLSSMALGGSKKCLRIAQAIAAQT